MISRFFIDRPVFSAVVSLVIVLAGAVSFFALPVAWYPNLAPPTVEVKATYPGASAEVVAETVARPVEEEVNGVEGMLYMQGTCSSDGSYTLAITFETGTDLDLAAVQVQNRVAKAEPSLPVEVTRQGVSTEKVAPDFAMMVSLVSRKGHDDVFLSNFATMRLKDQLARVPGVGRVDVVGAADYSMRLWLDPERMNARGLTTKDVLDALSEQNVQVAAGSIGAEPAPDGQAFQYTLNTLGRLTEAAQFENVIVKTDRRRITRVKDIGRVTLGAESYAQFSQLNGVPAATIIINQLPGSNLLEVVDECRRRLDEAAETFPEGVEHVYGYDASDVVRASIDEIVETLFIAMGLVILTVLVFLQDVRATIIPTVTIPVSLIGTLAVMNAIGFSLNTATLFGLVLAIGIVVDDAIVVVENVARNLEEGGTSARDAAVKAMEEVTGPVIATTLVLLAVFVPAAFMGGITGVLFNQFGLTIATATVFSSVNALTLSPSLCALLLKPGRKSSFVFRPFEWVLGGVTRLYGWSARLAIKAFVLPIAVLGFMLWGSHAGMQRAATSFVPAEDTGFLLVSAQLPDAASMQRTGEVVDKINTLLENTPGVRFNIAFAGNDILLNTMTSNVASHFVVLDPWDERQDEDLHAEAILGRIQAGLAGIQEAFSFAVQPPALPGLGLSGGFEMMVQDRGDVGLASLQQMAEELAYAGSGQDTVAGAYSPFRANAPQLFVDIDRDKVKTLGIPLQDVFDTLQAYLGSAYVNDFSAFGRSFKVNLQADARFRAQRRDILELRVRNPAGEMVPLSTFATVRESFGPTSILRHNMFPTARIMGSAPPGRSSGEALRTMSDLGRATLPPSMGFEWSGLSFQELRASGGALVTFGLAILLVYLVLAAQYESWALPFTVVMAVPMGVFGAIWAVILDGQANTTYTQIGLVLLVALVSKNAILIVEFAKEKHDGGMGVFDSAITAARARFRAILMTAVSFVLGTLPLLIATGAGAGARVALGTAVFYGLALATVAGVYVTPALYVAVQGLANALRPGKRRAALAAIEAAQTGEPGTDS